MAKKSDEPLSKHTLLLFEGDYERLQSLYPDIGAAVIVRKIVHEYLAKVAPPAKIKQPFINI